MSVGLGTKKRGYQFDGSSTNLEIEIVPVFPQLNRPITSVVYRSVCFYETQTRVGLTDRGSDGTYGNIANARSTSHLKLAVSASVKLIPCTKLKYVSIVAKKLIGVWELNVSIPMSEVGAIEGS